ncbi:sulfite exporter TauE/SafE family protein [Psychrosphaera algicola]|uniref:Probable membrane transporter protein n=1 Tax=Psychrosphaera algicola TaxID=3023714 RepID=A0ABT5FDV0_9GAMM|nr:sulfite exporter TauE/SafE family protein [Psychrosphaera sp. G1-22]MDC2889725.1 sulfite exporter TauE/SafE family protein [Psychrosphaera sp. G1-22]
MEPVYRALVGFGLGLLSAPLVFLIDPELVLGPMILLALLNTVILSLKFKDKIDVSQTKLSLIGGTFGVFFAAIFIGLISIEQYQKIFGFLVLLAVSLSVLGIKPKVNYVSSLVASFVSGVMGTITSAGGAPMGLLYQSEEKSTVKANLSIFFVYLNAIAIIALLLAGKASTQDFIHFLQLAPAILIGICLSNFINNLINPKLMRILVLLVATISGMLLIT